MLLAIDTSAGTSVAVVDPATGRAVAERSTEDSRRHAEVIGPFLAEVLAEAGVGPEAVTHVVAGMGPGPFTGLRVGIAAARTFAAARGVPCLPLVSHDAVAAGQVGPVVVVTDARRREVYWSAYDASGARVAGPGLARPDDLDAVLGDHASWSRVTAASDSSGERSLGAIASWSRVTAASDSSGERSLGAIASWSRVTAASIPAWRLGAIAADRLTSGAPFADDVPLYLRDPDVTMPGAPKRVRS